MFEVYPRPDLPELDLPSLPPVYGSVLLVAGNGRDRGSSLVWDPNGNYSPGPTGGYAWGPSSHVRWGHEQSRGVSGGREGLQHARVRQLLRRRAAFPESQAVPGDSGGGVFTLSVLGDGSSPA